MRLIAFIAEPAVAKQILDHLGLDSTGPPLARPRADQGDSVEPAPAYDAPDPVERSTDCPLWTVHRKLIHAPRSTT